MNLLVIAVGLWLLGPAPKSQVGQKAPPLSPKLVENSTLQSDDDLKGKVLLYEFFAYW